MIKGFNDGDTVRSIKGGPLMTVEDIRSDDLISTSWFDDHNILHRDCFPAITLEKWQRVD